METVLLYRLSGLAVMVGMVINGLASVFYPRTEGVTLFLNSFAQVDNLAKLCGSLIFLLGLPGLYAFQAARAGRLGLAGFSLSFLGLALLEVGTDTIFAFVGPALAEHQQTRSLVEDGFERSLGSGFLAYLLLAYLVVVAGFVAFGVATYRAHVYRRWTGPTIAIGAVAAIVLAPLVAVPSGVFRLDRIGVLAVSVAFVCCGFDLLRHRSAAAPG